MELGEGSYGKVSLRNGKAVKKFQKLPHLIQEYTSLNYLSNCEHILHSTGINISENEIELKLYSMDLHTYIKENKDKNKDLFIRQILYGLIELHDRGLTHGDIKPDNILVDVVNNKCVISDCGFVSLSKYSKVERTALKYRDLIVDSNEFHDIYSMGIILLQWKYGINISKNERSYEVLKNIIENKIHDKNEKRVLLKMVCENKKKRLTARKILYLLYHEDRENTFKNHVYKKIENELLKEKFELYTSYMKFSRWKKAYYALSHYINKHSIDKDKYIEYTVCCLFIISCLFSKKYEHDENKIIIYANNHLDKTVSKRKIYDILIKLMENKIFVKMLFEL